MLQQNTGTMTQAQKDILDLEKKYFGKLMSVISSTDFQNDLRAIETEIKLNYSRLASTWNIKNKLKVAAERLVRHHVYKNLMSDICGIYESPLSSDLGVVCDDCVLCVDCKTLDTDSNKTDIRYTSVEANQTSFDNSNYPYITTESHLEKRARVSRLPVLTYIIKIIYRDNNVQFDISRTNNPKTSGFPSLVLTCIPNGELSDLFGKNLIKNFKTYKYYTEKDGKQYAPVIVPANVDKKEEWAESYCLGKGYSEITISQDNGTKNVFYDAINKCCWTYTSNNNKKMIRAIMRGDSMRLNNNDLKNRLDSSNQPWNGYIEIDI